MISRERKEWNQGEIIYIRFTYLRGLTRVTNWVRLEELVAEELRKYIFSSENLPYLYKRDKSCPNKEIIQERLEEYVLCQLEECILKEDVFSKLIEDMRANFAAKQSEFVQEVKRLQQVIPRLETRKKNIIKAITNGFMAEDFKDELANIEAERETAER